MRRIEELEELIKYHKAIYYQGRPEISDIEFDRLEEELRTIDPKNPVLEIIGKNVSDSKKIKHDHKMLSLGKTYKWDELKSWMGDEDVISTYKIDGVSCSLIYEEGRLSLAKTRGDGSFGEDITNRAIWVRNIPAKILNSKKVEIRGELFIIEENFFHLSDEMISIGLEKPSSQRNIVAGLMGRKDHVELCRFISFKAFDLIDENKNFKEELDKIEELKKFGFQIPHIIRHKDDQTVLDSIEETKNFMAEGDYQIDGIVFTYNRIELQNELGETAHHPRYKMAFKFMGEAKTTILKKINWSLSRNGILTPVGEIEPTQLSGATITNVTLHNYGLVKQFNLKSGDKIEIIRAGEVIPKFVNLVESSNDEFEIPESCPSCKGPIEIVDIRLYCSNEACPGKTKESILNFIQKIGIEDISSKRLDEMIAKGLVVEIPDLYRLNVEDFLTLDKVKEKLAKKFKATIDQSKKVELTKFLGSLGIQGGAFNKCEKVVHAGFNSIEKILNLNMDDLLEIDGFAEKSANEFFNSLEVKKPLIEKLLEEGFEFHEVVRMETAISGKKICITGALSQKRSVIETMIRDSGGVVVAGVSKNTDILVTNEKNSSSSKFKKAVQLEKKIIDEEELLNLIRESSL